MIFAMLWICILKLHWQIWPQAHGSVPTRPITVASTYHGNLLTPNGNQRIHALISHSPGLLPFPTSKAR